MFNIFEKLKLNPPQKFKIEYIIVGLGNMGLQYEKTRHNAGFLAIDKISNHFNIDVKMVKFKSLVGQGNINGKGCLLMKPQTYMNNSGEAVIEVMNFYKIPLEKVVVLYDDISLPVEKLRIRRKGSAGGHNGIKDIIELTGSEVFTRIKIGIGQKPHKDYNLADWVLSKFSEKELENLNLCFEKCIDIINLIVQNNIDKAMNKYNN